MRGAESVTGCYRVLELLGGTNSGAERKTKTSIGTIAETAS